MGPGHHRSRLRGFPSSRTSLGKLERWSQVNRSAGCIAPVADERRVNLNAWGIIEGDLQRFAAYTCVQVITPGSSAGVPLHSSLRSNTLFRTGKLNPCSFVRRPDRVNRRARGDGSARKGTVTQASRRAQAHASAPEGLGDAPGSRGDAPRARTLNTLALRAGVSGDSVEVECHPA